MFAINHAASALIFKKQLRNKVSVVWVLLSVQFVELLWVLLNLLGVENTVTEKTVNYVGDIHLDYMPFSHSVLSSFIIAVVGGGLFLVWKRSWRVAIWMALALLSHIVLDLLTHAADIPLGFSNNSLLGMGLYSSAPIVAFFLELAFGIFCWWYYKGSKSLFWIILLFNLANLTMFVPQIKGLEFYLADKPVLISVVILVQILLTLFLVGRTSGHQGIIEVVETR
ncbi:hypothetical protein [Allomuricauda sp. CP2A]|jgi:membrane-bound metal-dependent hydrolase YbcI (DUF457 family)|uniref:hypothetical protein n=1 Tax=Allomuricauda sp. CP2A TaxID=1848189 RepID=UPI000829A0C6|nr:hypothetical protein [Muricauda sp. CP2A]